MLSDRQLLEGVLTQRDEDAFTVLVHRHAALVMRTPRMAVEFGSFQMRHTVSQDRTA